MGSVRLITVIAFVAAIVLVVATPGSSWAQQPPPFKHDKLSSILAQLVNATQSVPQSLTQYAFSAAPPQPGMQAYLDAGLMSIDGWEQIQVYIHVTSATAGDLAELVSRNAVVERQSDDGHIIQARLPISNLAEIAGLDFVKAVTLPQYGHSNVGSKLTEGDALLDFDDLRTTLGVDGTGVTVGVISDGIFGLEAAIASGDLPATTLVRDGGGKLTSTSGGVIAASFRGDGDLEGGLGAAPTGAEGTAMLEIIRDIAPGAQLRFANFNTSLEFIAAVDFLAANSDIVVDDIGFFRLPYDQTSDVSTNTATELNRLTNPIRGYYNAVGNQARSHYQELYVNSGVDGSTKGRDPGSFHQFAATGSTTDCLDLGTRTSNLITVDAGATATVYLTWDDTFGSATSDYDMFAFETGTNTLVGASINNNITLGDPWETVSFTNNSASLRSYDIFVQNYLNASVARTFDIFVLGAKTLVCGDATTFNYNTLSSSVPGQSDAGGGVVSVGAINASDPGADNIASYSSQGPTNNGATKPDVTAVDGVSVTGSGGFFDPFYGTSAAAPHVAALAALLLEVDPDLKSGEPGDDPAADRAALRAAIVGTSVDLGQVGTDNTFGAGRVNGLNAGQALTGSPTPTPTATATPTPEPVPSMSTWGMLALGVAFGLILWVRMRRRASVN